MMDLGALAGLAPLLVVMGLIVAFLFYYSNRGHRALKEHAASVTKHLEAVERQTDLLERIAKALEAAVASMNGPKT